jgi:hypothetical protein
VNDSTAKTTAGARDVEREARAYLEYHLLPLHTLVGRLEDGVAPAFSSRLLVPAPDGFDRTARGRDRLAGATGTLADADPALCAAVERLRRTPWFRLRFAWARLRGRLPA